MDSTLGLLFNLRMKDNVIKNRHFLCFTLEDEYRDIKKYGETRIPAGTYKIQLRKEGKFHKRYKTRFSDIHNGMLWITDVPNFEYILIHPGNTDEHTDGCLLVGDQVQQNVTKKGYLSNSAEAYRRVYRRIARAVETEGATIQFVDFDTPMRK